MRPVIFGLAIATLVAFAGNSPVFGAWPTKTRADLRARRHANEMPWHGPYYHREYGQPVALVVPPTAPMHTQWSWGVAQTRVMPTWHQFGRSYPSTPPGSYAGPLYGTPAWPSHTDQFGVYPVRGPW